MTKRARPHKLREGRSKIAIHLVRDFGRVACFMSVDNGHLKQAGTPGVDWAIASPKSILLWMETRRGPAAGDIIEHAQYLSRMLSLPLKSDLMGVDLGRRRMGR